MRFFKLCLLAVCALLIFPIFLGSGSAKELVGVPIKIKIDGRSYEDGQGYYNKNGTPMIPLRSVSKALGYNVEYKIDDKSIHLMKGAHWIVVKLGKDSYTFGKMAPQKLGTIPEVKNGRTFVPLSFITEILRLDVKEEGKNGFNIMTIEEFPAIIGKIASIEKLGNGTQLELNNETGKGYEKIFLTIDNETTILNPITNEKLDIAQLKVGERIRGFYGPFVAEIYPPQSYSTRIEVLGDKIVKTDVITNIEKHDSHQYILVGTMEDGVRLFIDDKTTIVTAENKPLQREDLQKGMKVDAFYGPIQTMSLPPMSTAVKIIVH